MKKLFKSVGSFFSKCYSKCKEWIYALLVWLGITKINAPKRPKLRLGDPYVIMIENTSDEVQSYELFGYNLNVDRTNWSNPKEIKISNLFANYETDEDYKSWYEQLLRFSKLQNISAFKFRFTTNNVNNYKHNICISQMVTAGSNKSVNETILSKQIVDDLKYNQKHIADVNHRAVIDGDTSILGQLEPKSNITIAIYPLLYSCMEEIREYDEKIKLYNESPVLYMQKYLQQQFN